MGKIKINKNDLNNLIRESVEEAVYQGTQQQPTERSQFDEELSNISYLAERLEVYAQTIKEDYIPAIEAKYQGGIEALNSVIGNGAYSMVNVELFSDSEIYVTFKINSLEGFKKHIQEGNYRSVRYAIEDTADEEGIEEVTSENYQMLLDKTLSDSFTLSELLSDILNENLYGDSHGMVSASFDTSSANGTCRLEIELPFNIEDLESFINGRD